MGLIGAPLFLVLAAASILGLNEQASVASGIAVIPIFFWELSLGLWLTFKGFRPSAVAALASDTSETTASAAITSSPIATTTRRCRMTAERERTATLPPRLVVRTAWVLHRALYRFSGGRIGLRPPEPGNKFGMLRLRTVGRRPASRGSRSWATSRMDRTWSPWP